MPPPPQTIIKRAVDQLVAWHAIGRPVEAPAAESVRTYAIDPNALPSTIVYPVKLMPERGPGARGQLNRGPFGVIFEHRVKGDGTVPILEVLDPLLYWAVKAVSGKRQDNLIAEVEYGELTWELKQADFTYCLAKQLFVLTVQSNVADLSAWA